MKNREGVTKTISASARKNSASARKMKAAFPRHLVEPKQLTFDETPRLNETSVGLSTDDTIAPSASSNGVPTTVVTLSTTFVKDISHDAAVATAGPPPAASSGGMPSSENTMPLTPAHDAHVPNSADDVDNFLSLITTADSPMTDDDV